MGGGLMQLVAYGAQDIYLTGNPQITFFKVVYRRHTNFSIETIAQTFNGSADFNNKAQVTISRNGDLIGPMVLEVKLPKLHQDNQGGTGNVSAANYTDGVGNALIKSVSVEIGGQQIDKHYGEWLDIWGELNVKADHRVAYDQMVGNTFDRDISDPVRLVGDSDHETTLYVPLRFWFNRNPGLALPLIALQYHEVKIHFEFEDSRHLIRTLGAAATGMPQSDSGDVTMKSCQLLVDYIYLDTDERRRFAQVSHEYLIEQLQFTGAESISSNDTTRKVDLNFNHPVKALHWVIQHETFLSTSSWAATTDRRVTGNQKLRYSGVNHDATQTAYETFKNAKIQLNGHDRMSVRDADYFRLVQNDQHSEVVPRKMIYTYAFALKPAEHQPSGTCNFSRIDNAQLNLEFNSAAHTKTNDREMRVFAVNYNVLRIMSGMGGLAYSN